MQSCLQKAKFEPERKENWILAGLLMSNKNNGKCPWCGNISIWEWIKSRPADRLPHLCLFHNLLGMSFLGSYYITSEMRGRHAASRLRWGTTKNGSRWGKVLVEGMGRVRHARSLPAERRHRKSSSTHLAWYLGWYVVLRHFSEKDFLVFHSKVLTLSAPSKIRLSAAPRFSSFRSVFRARLPASVFTPLPVFRCLSFPRARSRRFSPKVFFCVECVCFGLIGNQAGPWSSTSRKPKSRRKGAISHTKPKNLPNPGTITTFFLSHNVHPHIFVNGQLIAFLKTIFYCFIKTGFFSQIKSTRNSVLN